MKRNSPLPCDDFDDDDIELGDEPDWQDEWEEFDCHMDRSGQCGMAGSEDCDFECPVMASIRAQERKKAKR